jgi:hypothetical protein
MGKPAAEDPAPALSKKTTIFAAFPHASYRTGTAKP